MATATDNLIHVSFPITKFEKDADGDIIVWGKATDGSVDSDDQIVDPEWSAKALADWHKTGGNVRVQHQARRDPAGKSLQVDVDKDGDGGHWVKSLVCEPVAKRLVEKGVLTAYSVGIARPVIKRDPTGRARGGIVMGGELAELSLVDRPANKNCGLVLAKSEGGQTVLTEELFGDTSDAEAKAEGSQELLTKDDGTGKDPGDPDAQPAGNPHEGTPANGPTDDPDDDGEDTSSGAGDVDGDQDDDGVSKQETDPIAEADGKTRAAYKTARREWLHRQPSVKNAVGGTEYLAKRAEWMRWDAEGRAEGLDGTRDGALLWLAKRDFSQAERDQAADSGAAMPDGSFPIKNGEDLGNAIHLAGHAKDPGAARAHIKRRAAALGMSDRIPDTWKGDVPAPADTELHDLIAKGTVTGPVAAVMLADPHLAKAGDGDGDGGKPCPTCKGDGKIMGNQRKCPDCNGSGKFTPKDAAAPDAVKNGAKSCANCGRSYDADTKIKNCEGCGKKLPKATKAQKSADPDPVTVHLDDNLVVNALAETLTKAASDGLLTPAAVAEIIAQLPGATKSGRPLPADTKPAGAHREPDGSSTVERLEPQAGMATDRDPVPDKVPASVKADAPYTVARMHDATCAAFSLDGVLDLYPAVKGVSDAIDPDWFHRQSAEAAWAGKNKKTRLYSRLADAATAVKTMDPAAVADGRAHLHKAFTDMYPSEHISPSGPRQPGSFQRPYLTAGHASQDADHKGTTHIPASAHTPEPEDFNRGLITAGHQADSPANQGAKADRPPVTTGAARTYYTTAARDAARTALQSMHDHIATSFPDLCPMASSKAVMPPDLGARNVPTPVHPPAPQSGIDVGKHLAGELRKHLSQAQPDTTPAPDLAKMIRKEIRKTLAGMAPDIAKPGPGLTGDELRTMLAEQLGPFAHRYQDELATFRKELDQLGAQPDPALSPVRGALAKADTPPAPVERRSLIEEAAERARGHAQAEEAAYRAYVQARAHSYDPGTREKALAVLEGLNKASAAEPAA